MRGEIGFDPIRINDGNVRVIFRFVIYIILWVVFDGGKPLGLLVGVPAAALATWLSIRLVPLGTVRLHPWAGIVLVWYFMRHSILAGVDVAWRAFHPKLPLRTGFVSVKCALPEGMIRDVHLAITSLMPGSIPIEVSEEGDVLLHCLDVGEPLAEQMTHQAVLVQQAIGGARDA